MRIGIVLATEVAHYRRIIRGVHAWARRHDAAVRHFPGEELAHGRKLAGDPQALVVQVGSDAKQDFLRRLGIPAVVVTGRVRPRLPAVLPDPRLAGALAADHLLGLGLRRLAWIQDGNLWISAERAQGFVRAAAERGFEVAILPGLEAIDELATDGEPWGIACATDQVAREAVQRLADRGIAVPERCAVIGMDDDDFMVGTALLPLSSIDLDSERIGWIAAEQAALLAGGGQEPARPILVPPRGIVARASSDMLAVADPVLADAVRLLRGQACRGLHVDDLLKRIPMSRRAFERAFRDLLGRTPAEELDRVRMAEARRLLGDTGMQIAGIARATGFASGRAFIRAFRRAHATTPGAWREANARIRQPDR